MDLPLRPAPISWAFATLLVIVHVVVGAWAWWGGAADALHAWVLPRPDRVLIGAGARYSPMLAAEPWRLLTSSLIHIDLLHLLVNAVGIALLGSLGEQRVGGRRWLLWFVVGSLIGSISATGAGVLRSCGASAGGTTWLVGLWVHARRRRAELMPEEAALMVDTLGYVVVGHLVLSALIPAIDVAAHVGGAIAGLVLGAFPLRRPALSGDPSP